MRYKGSSINDVTHLVDGTPFVTLKCDIRVEAKKCETSFTDKYIENHKRTTSSLAPPIFYVAKKSAIKR